MPASKRLTVLAAMPVAWAAARTLPHSATVRNRRMLSQLMSSPRAAY
jgi:hypothetical protein